jgi:hypothetical protein
MYLTDTAVRASYELWLYDLQMYASKFEHARFANIYCKQAFVGGDVTT